MAEFAINDRVANYGDGIFSTLSVVDGRIALYARHLDRLCHNAQALGITFHEPGQDRQALGEALRNQARGLKKGTLKVLISAGVGGRGYARPPSAPATWHFSSHSAPAHYNHWRQHGIRLGASPVRLAEQPLLAGLKHCNRLEQVLVKQAIREPDQDALVCDQHGHIVEASAANIFWLANGVWHTPALTRCGVAGVMREFILDHLKAQGIAVKCDDYPLPALEAAEAIFLCNALMQIVPVHTWQNKSYDIAPVQALAAQLSFAYQDEYDSN